MVDEWEARLETERKLRQQLVELGPNGDKKARRELAREWFAQTSQIMKTCAQESRDGQLRLIPPVEVFAVFAGLADDLSRGLLREPFTDVTAPGRPPVSAREQQDLGYATAYLQAVERGHIADETPIKTIAEAYGVRRQTVQGWKKLPLPDTARALERDPQGLISRVSERGEFYRMAGRSALAFLNRSDG